MLVSGNYSHLEEIGLAKLAPWWSGERQDLLTVGEESYEEKKKWSKMKQQPTEKENRIIIT